MEGLRICVLLVSVTVLGLTSAEDCFHQARQVPGVCMPVNQCSSAVKELAAGGYPQPCDFPNGHTVVSHVCCPAPAPARPIAGAESTATRQRETCEHGPVKQPRIMNCEQLKQHYAENPLPTSGKGLVSRRMCRKHQLDLCALPEIFPSSLCPAAGWPANILEFPHMALLGFGKNKDDIDFSCGGSLISPDFILTAAHCRQKDSIPVGWALVGTSNRTQITETQDDEEKDTRQLIEVAEIIVHPGYKPPLQYNDVALLRLAHPVRMKPKNVYPACLHTDVDEDPVGQEAIATGWGQVGFFDDASDTLIKVNLTVRPLQFCKDQIKVKEGTLPRGFEDTHLCAGGGSHGRDTCQGDSGGPLQVKADPTSSFDCMHRIVGVVSFGPPCGLGKPGVYSRVAAFVPWIESIVWPTENDKCHRMVPLNTTTGVAFGNPVLVPDSGPGTIARRMCRAYHENFCDVYHMNGNTVRPGLTVDTKCHHRYPIDFQTRTWKQKSEPTVTLSYGTPGWTREWACAGSLVSPRYILTAAHCAKLGCLSPDTVTIANPGSCDGHSTFKADEIIVHPDFRDGEPYNNLALIRLNGEVDLREYMPVCLHTSTDGKVEGTSAIGAGWNVHPTSGIWDRVEYWFSRTNLRIRAQDRCAAMLSPATRRKWTIGSSIKGQRPGLPRGLLDSQVCAGGVCGNDTYPGNPGGPLEHAMYLLDTNFSEVHKYPMYRLVGVEAYSPPCGSGLPDVFTRVSSFTDWIESVIWPDEN